MSSPSAGVHFLVIIHGMWGNPGHCAELNRIIRETHTEEMEASADLEGVQLEVLVAQSNRAESTHDGIDWGGERVAKEVTDRIQEIESSGRKVTRFSVTGYSLGGLVGRYLVGILYQRGFFKTIVPVNFHTIATPHLGIPRLRNLIWNILSSLAPWLSRTGEQIFCVDKWGPTGKPLLQVMADSERIFYRALALFSNIVCYANAINDRTVPYITSAIEIQDPFADHETNGIEVQFDEKYSPVISCYTVPDVPPPPPPRSLILSPSWFHDQKPRKRRFFLPPWLQARFPFNLVVYMFLPAVIPLVLSILLVYLPFGAYYSRARIRLLENDGSNSQKLINVIDELEQDVEDTVVDIIGNAKHTNSAAPQDKSVLTPLQLQIATSLNKLPMKKHLAYILGVANSHAVIVCRDVNRFEAHRIGEGVLRHYAASFIL